MNCTNVIVSIGFMKGDEIMKSDERLDFIRDVRNTLSLCFEGPGSQIVQAGPCTGYWDGKEEPCYTVTTSIMDGFFNADMVEVLEERLSMLSVRYDQEAIALTVARPQFIDQSAYRSLFTESAKLNDLIEEVQHQGAIGEIEYETVRSAVEPLLERLYGEYGDAAIGMIDKLVNGQMRDFLFMEK